MREIVKTKRYCDTVRAKRTLLERLSREGREKILNSFTPEYFEREHKDRVENLSVLYDEGSYYEKINEALDVGISEDRAIETAKYDLEFLDVIINGSEV